MSEAATHSKGAVLGGALLYCAGGLMFVFTPAFLGDMQERFGLSPADLGTLSAVELWAIALASFLGPFWITRVSWRTLVRFGAAAALAGQVASLFVANFHMLMLVRMATGLFGEGVLLALSYSTLGQTRNVERSFSLAYGASIVIGMIGLYASPELNRALGTVSVLVVLAGAAGAAFLSASLLPDGPVKQSFAPATRDRKRPASVWRSLGAVALLTQAIWYAGAGGFWSFTEQLASMRGIGTRDIAHAMGIGTAAALVGSMLALFLNGRFGRTIPIALSTVLAAVSIVAFMGSTETFFVVVELASFNVFWASGTIYVTAATCAFDEEGNIAVLVPAFQVAGMAVGTAVLGHTIERFGPISTPWTVMGFFGASLVLLFLFQTRAARSRRQEERARVIEMS